MCGLLDLGITALWFEEEKCESMRGNGKAWAAVSAREHLMPTPRTAGVKGIKMWSHPADNNDNGWQPRACMHAPCRFRCGVPEAERSPGRENATVASTGVQTALTTPLAT